VTAAGKQVYARHGRIVRLIRWFMTPQGMDYQVRTGILERYDASTWGIIENGVAVVLPRAEWAEYLP